MTDAQYGTPGALVTSANIFTAEQTVPDLKASGLTGATAASRYVGATASGAPVAGTFAIGDFVIDQTGIVWICTTAGSPGSWTAVQPNVELGYAQIIAQQTTVSTSMIDATGLSVTVAVGARPILVRAFLQIANTLAGAFTMVAIDEDGTQVALGFAGAGSANELWPINVMARRAPAAGSHTYKVQFDSSSASNTSKIGVTGANAPSFIQVVQV